YTVVFGSLLRSPASSTLFPYTTLFRSKASFGAITASAATVAIALLCLLVSDLSSNQSLGPIAATGIFFAWVSALTLLPALLYLRSEEHTSELQSRFDLVCRLLLEHNHN